MKIKTRVNIIGAGNVATHLSKALFTGRVEIVSVYSRDFINARALSHQFGAKAVDNVCDVADDVDLNIVTIKDDAIASVASQLNKTVPVVHSSGSAPIDVFHGFNQFGVLYPLQTFSKQRALDIAAIPFLIEGNSIEFTAWLINFCETYLSENAHRTDSKMRSEIHLAAIFACNFTTQLLQESDLLLQQSNLDLSVLHPLIKETMEKVMELGPKEAMTGPAKRGDIATIEKHMNQLNDADLKVLYKLLSDRISSNF
ncbi:MAG: putative short-subunit dehydrogenase-like oxidoreductase (DUF2520 family) [Crocinitomix sp.]|jgi:predicted short-subunit dehydrogenase-like oxidoreductase (DUF2520 family)